MCAALLGKVNCGVIAVLILGNGILPDDVLLRNIQSLNGSPNALNVSIGVAFVFVTQEDNANLVVGGIASCRAALIAS